MCRSVLVVLLTGLVYAGTLADRSAEIRANYSKQEVRIAMRDGLTLFTSIFTPKDDNGPYPILLLRTPYAVDPYGPDQYPETLGPSQAYESEGFIFVFQDVRGRFMSQGDYVNMRPHVAKKRGAQDVDESTDTYDTVAWLVGHLPNNNGRVGQWGISYPGFYASAGMIDSHPALKAVSPQAPISDWFWDDMHHHGATILPLTFGFFFTFGLPREGLTRDWPPRFSYGTPDGYDFFMDLGPLSNVNDRYFHDQIPFWNAIVEHPNYDAFWQSRSILPHLNNVGAAVLIVGGWFDAEDLYGPLKTYASVEQRNPNTENTIVMGPWSHGGWHRTSGADLGDARFGEPRSPYFEELELAWFLHHLKDGPDPQLAEALMFETGANRWRRFDAWPPRHVQSRSIYLREDHRLAFEPPRNEGSAFDSYVSDPAKPVPYTKVLNPKLEKTYMTEDQRFVANRPDVLVYQTDVLDRDVRLAGPIQVDLKLSTSGTAGDFIVKLIDVHPDAPRGVKTSDPDYARGGMQALVRGDVFRGRFREGYDRPQPFLADEITDVSFELSDVLHCFQKGQRIMVQIQSTWFPLVDRNPQTYVDNIFKADPADFGPARVRVYRSADHPSRLGVQVIGQGGPN